MENVLSWQDDWYLVWDSREELEAAALRPVPRHFNEMRTRLERYKYQDMLCWHRLDHTSHVITDILDDVLQCQLAILGLENVG
eukprot:18532-Eustigmatos_ZCMA.PRE.1